MNTYHMTAVIDGVGPRQHTLKAETPSDAQERFKRCYPDREVIFTKYTKRPAPRQDYEVEAHPAVVSMNGDADLCNEKMRKRMGYFRKGDFSPDAITVGNALTDEWQFSADIAANTGVIGAWGFLRTLLRNGYADRSKCGGRFWAYRRGPMWAERFGKGGEA